MNIAAVGYSKRDIKELNNSQEGVHIKNKMNFISINNIYELLQQREFNFVMINSHRASVQLREVVDMINEYYLKGESLKSRVSAKGLISTMKPTNLTVGDGANELYK